SGPGAGSDDGVSLPPLVLPLPDNGGLPVEGAGFGLSVPPPHAISNKLKTPVESPRASILSPLTIIPEMAYRFVKEKINKGRFREGGSTLSYLYENCASVGCRHRLHAACHVRKKSPLRQSSSGP